MDKMTATNDSTWIGVLGAGEKKIGLILLIEQLELIHILAFAPIDPTFADDEENEIEEAVLDDQPPSAGTNNLLKAQQSANLLIKACKVFSGGFSKCKMWWTFLGTSVFFQSIFIQILFLIRPPEVILTQLRILIPHSESSGNAMYWQ